MHACLLSALLWVAATEPGQPAPKTKDQILKQFAEEFVSITPGKGDFPASFQMGSSGNNGRKDEKPAHSVRLSQPFAIAKYEVTQELYQAIMGKNPAKWKGPRNSVEMVSWDEASEFCKKVTEELRKRKLLGADKVIRLPTEAEWEYCCRAGSTTPYSFGQVKDIKEYCWYNENSKGHDPPVGKKKPNAWGLYDMHGYVWEWCSDWYGEYPKEAVTDPQGAKSGKERVMRGASYADPAERCRSAARGHKPPETRNDTIGFRCVRAKGK